MNNRYVKKGRRKRITNGYGESGLEIPGRDSDLTSVLGTELICGGGSAMASAFCTVGAAGLASGGAGRALLVTVGGSRAVPSC